MAKLLLVDDDPKINNIVCRYLQHAGHEVCAVFNGRDAAAMLSRECFELGIFDVMLPDANGFELLEQMRLGSYFATGSATPVDVPVIMLTALGESSNIIYGLKTGADDYVTKPFEPAELVQRIAAILRRSGRAEIETGFRFGDLTIDQRSRQIKAGETALELQRRETDLLAFLCQHPDQAFSREELLNKVWGWDYEGSDRAVDICIQRVRSKLKAADSSVIIHTVWGMGYRLSVVMEAKLP